MYATASGGSALQRIGVGGILLPVSTGLAGAGTAALMGGAGMDIFAGFGTGFAIGALNHGWTKEYGNGWSYELDEVVAIGRRTFHGVPIRFISESLSFNSYIFGAINIQKSSYETFLKKGPDSNAGRVLMHEYGHYLQEKLYGSYRYYTEIAPESAFNISTLSIENYRTTWTEVNANTLSYIHFGMPSYWDFKTYPVSYDLIRRIIPYCK